MTCTKSGFACVLGMVAALTLAGCGDHASAPAGTGAAPALSTSASSAALSITSWGPQETKAGEAFNKQPDGSAALWIRLNHSLDGEEAAVEFNGVLLPANISGNLVTVTVPAHLYASAGRVNLHVVAREGTQSVQSNDVTFTVD